MPCAAGFVVDSWSERLQHQAAHWISPQTVRGHSRRHPSSFLPACQSVLFAFLSIHPSSRSRLFSLLCLSWIMIRSLPWYVLIDWAFWLTNESAPQGHVAVSFGINVDSAEKTPDTTDLALNGFVWIWLQEGVCWGVIFNLLPVALLIAFCILSPSDMLQGNNGQYHINTEVIAQQTLRVIRKSFKTWISFMVKLTVFVHVTISVY